MSEKSNLYFAPFKAIGEKVRKLFGIIDGELERQVLVEDLQGFVRKGASKPDIEKIITSIPK